MLTFREDTSNLVEGGSASSGGAEGWLAMDPNRTDEDKVASERWNS